MIGSTPSFNEFDPTHIHYQCQVIDKIKLDYDYTQGVHEVLLSGSVGSAKSLLMAHLAVRHCIEHPRARVLLGRKTLPDLRDTIYRKIVEHLQETFAEGSQYQAFETNAKIRFRNGSEILSRSWADKKYKKFRSLELSMAIIEELTENDDEDKEAIDEIRLRVGRLMHVPEQLILYATNPDSPSHWAYEYFKLHLDEGHKGHRDFDERGKTKHVFYSRTIDNPFLPKSYLEQLKENYDPKMYERMGEGRWIEIKQDVIYHCFSPKHNYTNKSYEINPYEPIHVTWDFNIGQGKPLSLCLFQFIDGIFHIFHEIVIDGIDTFESLEELVASKYLIYPTVYYIHGDAAGQARSTASKRSDYDIIKKFLSNLRINGNPIDFRMAVPKSNPAVRDRHNTVNAYCLNAKKERRLMVYGCKMLEKGLRLTALKKSGQYIEDDSKEYQHVTTALGYGMVWCHKNVDRKPTYRTAPR